MKSPIFLTATVIVCLAGYGPTLSLWGAEAEVCSSAAATIPDAPGGGVPGDPLFDILAVDAVLSIDDVKVDVDITHGFIGDLAMGVVSPQGTFVQFFGGDGEDTVDFLVTFSDDGAEYGSESWTCACEVKPGGPGVMADFDDELSNGEWVFIAQDFFPPDEGTLEEWCVKITGCDLTPPSELTCEATADAVSLTWTNPEDADGLTIFRNGEELATLDSSATSYSDEGIPAGIYTYHLVAVNDAKSCDSLSLPCIAIVGLNEYCTELTADNEISFGLDPVISALDVKDEILIDDLLVQVDITHTWDGDLKIILETPDTSSIALFDKDSGSPDTPEEDMHVTYADVGVPHASVSLNCACFMQAIGPGLLADVIPKSSVGTWTLSVEDTFDMDDGTLDNWCLGLIGALDTSAGPTFIRGDSDGNGAVSGLGDALYTLRFFFIAGNPAPPCREAADADGNGVLSGLQDPLYTLRFAFTGGTEPPAPYPACGAPDEIFLSCDEPTVCP